MPYATLPFEVPGVTGPAADDPAEPVLLGELVDPDEFAAPKQDTTIGGAGEQALAPQAPSTPAEPPPLPADANATPTQDPVGVRTPQPVAAGRDRRQQPLQADTRPAPADAQPKKWSRRVRRAIDRILAHVKGDPEQLAAVTHGEGPLLVFAGPGTGKTRTLTTRIAYLVESGMARLQEILAVTFTVEAADEMRLRLVELLGQERAGWATVCTFHSLCYRIVRAHAGVFGRDSEYEIADPATLRKLTRAILAHPPTGELARELAQARTHSEGDLVDDVLRQIGAAKNRMWTIEQHLEHAQEMTAPLAAAVWRELERRLRKANLFAFDDLLVCTAALLTEDDALCLLYGEDGAAALPKDGSLCAHYREQYRWMLIDEFQDTNIVQLAIVRSLMAPQGNLTVVGDDDQSLYGFRQAEPANILEFTELFPTAKTIKLERNYRCRERILNHAGRLIEHNQIRVPKLLVPQAGAGGFVEARFYPSDEEEAACIAELIDMDIAMGRDPSQILVLCRNASPLIFCQTRLQERGIKVRLIGAQSLWERTEVRDAIARLSLIANPYDLHAFERAVKAPSDRRPFTQGEVKAPKRGIDEQLAHIVHYANVNRIDLIAATLRADEIDGVPVKAVVPLREFAAALDRIAHAASPRGDARLPVGGLVDRVLRMPGGPLDTYTMLRDQARDREVAEDAKRVVEDLRSLGRAAHTYEDSARETIPSLRGFLDSLAVDEHHEVHYGADDRLNMVTMHSAKGLEAEIVFCIAVEQRLIPDFRAMHAANLIEEERRLLYTAETRAKDNLILTHVGTRNGRPTHGPSQFLREGGHL